MTQLITLLAQGLYILGMAVMSWHVVKYNPPNDPAEWLIATAVIVFWPAMILIIGVALVLESFKESP